MISKNEEILHLLFQHFPQLAEKRLQENIAEVGSVYSFKEGEVIMDFGSYVRLIPLVTKGNVKVLRENDNGQELLLYYIGEGDTCSMSFTCCMMHKQSIIKTVAEDDVELIGIPVRHMDEWMSKYQSWKNFVMLSYDNRMMELINTIDNIAFKNMDERLEDYLQKKAQQSNSKFIFTTHQQIASDLNASREAVSRLLKQLENMERVKLGRNRIEWVG